MDKIDARGYDALNRTGVVTYSDSTPTDNYCDDGKIYPGGSCTTPGSSISVLGRMADH